MSCESVVKVENLSKCYQIYDRPHDRLKQFLLPTINRMIGRDERRYFREFWALRNVSFDVKKGETIGLVGRNGGGKSTLLQIICGVLGASDGSVRVNGRVAALLELGSGFNPEFTGEENIFLNGAVLGADKSEIERRYDEIAAFADIGPFIKQPVKSYSSGMVVRLAFAVQAMIDPDILIVDEALAVGDEKFQRKCFTHIEKLKAKGCSILFVSHSGPQVIELCDRAVLLESGELLMEGVPASVVRSYQRMIYAPKEGYAEVVASIRQSDISESTFHISENRDSPEKTAVAEAIKVESTNPYFDAGLLPTTTTRYAEHGAKIDGFDIFEISGKRVNVLLQGEVYRFVIHGRFMAELQNVFFGIHIKSITGAEITGQRYPSVGKYIDSVSSGKDFSIAFEFRMSLPPETYFVGGGVWSENPECAHRILDAIMFRVLPPKSIRSFGYCDLAVGSAELQIK